MTDIFNKDKRSQIMSRIKGSKNTSTELKLISIFAELGIKGWRRGIKMIGKPDFVFPKTRIVVFADGCFWHGHKCQKTKPQTNKDFWETKITQNMMRDELVSKTLTDKNWTVIRIWECELKKKNRDFLLQKLKPLITLNHKNI